MLEYFKLWYIHVICAKTHQLLKIWAEWDGTCSERPSTRQCPQCSDWHVTNIVPDITTCIPERWIFNYDELTPSFTSAPQWMKIICNVNILKQWTSFASANCIFVYHKWNCIFMVNHAEILSKQKYIFATVRARVIAVF